MLGLGGGGSFSHGIICAKSGRAIETGKLSIHGGMYGGVYGGVPGGGVLGGG